jgi:hypothetical protein
MNAIVMYDRIAKQNIGGPQMRNVIRALIVLLAAAPVLPTPLPIPRAPFCTTYCTPTGLCSTVCS